MFISTTENNRWQECDATEKKGILLTLGEEKQTVRGFGTCLASFPPLP